MAVSNKKLIYKKFITISIEIRYACFIYTDCDKQIIAGILNKFRQSSEGRNVDQFYSSFIRPTNC